MAMPWTPNRRGIRVTVDISGAGTTELVAASGTKQYRLLRWVLTNDDAGKGTFYFNSSVAGALCGLRRIGPSGCQGEEPPGGLECTAGEALQIVTTGASLELDGDIWYEEIQKAGV